MKILITLCEVNLCLRFSFSCRYFFFANEEYSIEKWIAYTVRVLVLYRKYIDVPYIYQRKFHHVKVLSWYAIHIPKPTHTVETFFEKLHYRIIYFLFSIGKKHLFLKWAFDVSSCVLKYNSSVPTTWVQGCEYVGRVTHLYLQRSAKVLLCVLLSP